jgi:Tubulin like
MPVQPQTRAIKRTMIIGLGGTGRDVLMRVRRFIIDKHGKLDNLPIVSFLHIDTDRNAFNSSGLPTGNTYHGEDILLQSSERVFISMNAQDVNNLVHDLEHKTLFDSPHSHIENWLDPRLKNQITSIENGAGGIRPIGRLAFFHNFGKIKEAVEAAERRTTGKESFMFSRGFNVEEGLNIFVVGSVCGGTGSGIFLDVAYTLRHLFQKNTEYTSFGYLVISPKLYGDAAIMKANTYAALKELDHYTIDGNTFEACYDKQNFVQVSQKRRPFDFTYLVSNRTSGDYQIDNKGKLCNVIAYKIFLDFADEVAYSLKSNRDNFKDPMLRKDGHPFGMCRGYMTFGLARVYFTRDRIVQIALNRLTLKLINFWLEGFGQSPDGRDLLNQFLSNWTSQSNQDYFTVRLEESTQENNQNFSTSLSRWKNSLEAQIAETQEIEDLKQSIKRSLEQIFRTVQPGESESSRGVWLTACQKIRPSLGDQFQADIDRFLEKLLSPDDLGFSLANARAFGEALQTKLSQIKRDLEETAQTNKGLHSPDEIEKLWKNTEQNIVDLEKQKSFFDRFSKNRHNDKIKADLSDAMQKAQKLSRHNFSVTVNEEARKIVETLQKHLANRMVQIQQLKESFDSLSVAYRKYEDELRQLNLDEMTGEGIFPEDNIETCLPDSNSRTQYVSISQNVLSNLGHENSLFSLLRAPIMIEESILKESTSGTIEKLFQTMSINKIDSVIKRFIESYSFGDFPRRLEQVLRNAEPLLSLNINDGYYGDRREKELIIGAKDDDSPAAQRFKNILEINSNINLGKCFKPIQVDDEILITYEFGAFPLRLINDLSDMRVIYQDQRQRSVLHNDFQREFTDIIPPNGLEVENLEYLFYPCLALGLLDYNEMNDSYDCQCYDSLRRKNYIVSLSPVWREALETLITNPELKNVLLQKLIDAKTEIKQQPDRLLQGDYRQFLDRFINWVDHLPKEHPNYPYKAKVVGDRETVPIKEGIITRFIRQLEDEICPPPPILPPTNRINNNQNLLPD